MRSKIKLIDRFSRPEASVYSLLEETAADAPPELLLDRFIERYRQEYTRELMDIGRRLQSMGYRTGCSENFFKMDEGLEADDLVCALYDVPDRYLRLYCIRLSDQIVILGDGGPKTTRTWQEDIQLTRAVGDTMHISRIVRTKMARGDLWISPSGLRLEGDLYISRT